MIDLSEFGEMYHDFKVFGALTKQKGGIFRKNQKCKAPIISAYIRLAIAKSKQGTDKLSFAELFCADAFYALLARGLGVHSAVGIDNNSSKFSNDTEKIAAKLGIDNYKFILEDVNNIHNLGRFDIVANVGGLYHVSNPGDILEKSYNMARQYLIVQSVVSMANNDPNYFEVPAPGWKHGSRYNKKSFDRLIKSFGWNIEDQFFNELLGNKDLRKRGSVYYLISK
jgi:hypothetical protein